MLSLPLVDRPMVAFSEKYLEQYTRQRPQEVLIVTAQIGENQEEVMIFRGFSSSLTSSTASDPDVSLLPPTVTFVKIDRLAAPYNPGDPVYLQRDLSWAEMTTLLKELAIVPNDTP